MSRIARITNRVAVGVLSGWLRGVFQELEYLLTDGQGATNTIYRSYLTYEYGTSSKFHAFAVYEYTDREGNTVYAGGNAYGRIGKSPKTIRIAKGTSRFGVESAVENKERAKARKGYDIQWSD